MPFVHLFSGEIMKFIRNVLKEEKLCAFNFEESFEKEEKLCASLGFVESF